MPSTTSRPPLTRLTTPGGRPSASSSSNAICCVSGTCAGGLHGGVEVGGAGERHARQDLAGRGVRDVQLVGGGGGGRPGAGDVVVDQSGGCGGGHAAIVHSWSGSFAKIQFRVGPAITLR